MDKKRFFLIILLLLILTPVAKLAYLWGGFQTRLADFPLQQKWSTELSQNIEQILIDENKVLVRTASRLYALNLQTGNVLWKFETGWLLQNEPIMIENGVVFLTDNKSVWQLDEESGTVLWSHFLNFPESAKIIGVSQNILVVFDGQQFFAYTVIGSKSFLWKQPVCRNSINASLQDSYIYYPCLGVEAIDIYTGESSWKDESIKIAKAVAYNNGALYFSQGYSKIIAYDLAKRTTVGDVPLKTDADQRLTTSHNFLFSTDESKICMLNRDKLQIDWCAGDIRNPQDFAIFEDNIYVLNGPATVVFYYDLLSGKKIGQIALPNLNVFTFFRNVIESSSQFLVFSSGNHLFAFGR